MKTILYSQEAMIDFNSPDNSPVIKSSENLATELNNKLHTGVAHFFFQKKDGSIREAYGTLKPETLTQILGEQQNEPVEAENSVIEPLTHIKYFDLEAMGFRTVIVSSLKALF